MPMFSHAHCKLQRQLEACVLILMFKDINNMQKQGVLGVSLDQNDNIYQFIVETLVAAHGMVTSPTS